MRSRPKIRLKPLATTNSRAAKVAPLSNWNAFIPRAPHSRPCRGRESTFKCEPLAKSVPSASGLPIRKAPDEDRGCAGHLIESRKGLRPQEKPLTERNYQTAYSL